MQALICMGIAILLYGLYPTALAFLSMSGVEPGSFLVFVHLFALLFVLAAAMVTRLSFRSVKATVKSVLTDDKSRLLLITAMGFNTLSNILIYVALGGAEKIQSAVIYETWPLFFILLTMFLRNEKDGGLAKLHSTNTTLSFLVIGLAGLGLVSTSGTEFDALFQPENWTGASQSLAAALGAAVSMSASAFFGTTLNRRLSTQHQMQTDNDQQHILPTITTAILFRTCSVFISMAYVLFMQENPFTNLLRLDGYIKPMMFASFVVGLGGTLFHYANVKSDHSNINFLWYFVPAIGAFSLILFGLETTLHAQILVGTILIIVSNLGLNLRVDYSTGYIAALIALSISSFVCLKFPAFPTANYFEALALILSLFAILVAFYSDRQFERFKSRKDLFLILFNEAEHQSDDELKDFVLNNNDAMTSSMFNRLYARYKESPEITANILRYFQEMKQSIPFADIFIIWLLGISAILLSILARDPSNYLSQFVPVVLSVAVVFLCVSTSQDLRVRYGGKFLMSTSSDLGEIFGSNTVQDTQMRSLVISIVVLITLLGLQFTAALLSLQ